MTIKEFYDELFFGHDIIFDYKGEKYFIEHNNSSLELYRLEDNKTGKIIFNLSCDDKDVLIKEFSNKKMMPNNQSILDIFNEIQIIDIEWFKIIIMVKCLKV